MTHDTPVPESLRKRRRFIRDLQLSALIVLCIYIIWHEPTETYLAANTIQAISRAVSTHMGREANAQIATASTKQPHAILDHQNSTAMTMDAWLGSIKAQQYPTVLVTALYDIGRGQHGRSIQQYKQWFAHTLKITSPIVVFVGDPELADFIKQHRQGLPTHIEQRPLEQVYYSNLGPWVASVQQSQQWKQCVRHASRLEWLLPHYITITWAKLGFMNEVISNAELSSIVGQGYFAWIDAGAGRWTKSAEGKIWPNIQTVQQRDPEGDSLIAQAPPKPDSTANIKSFLCGTGDGVMGAALIGKASTWTQLYKNFNKLVYDELLPNDWIGNEQMLLKILLDRNVTKIHLLPTACPPKGCGAGTDPSMASVDWLL